MPPKIICALILSSMAGCTMGPDYHQVLPTVPNHWQADLTTGLKPVNPETLKTWWKGFNDPQLDQLMNQALAGNLDIKIAQVRIDQARAERRGTRGELLPTVNIKAGAQRTENPFPGLAPGIKYNMFEIGFDAIWEIDLFGRQQRRLEAAIATLQGAEEEYRQSLVVLTSELTRSYIEYRNLQNQLRITHSNLESQQKTLALTEQLYNEGVSARHDVVRARAQTEITTAQIPTLEADLFSALRQLEVLVGRTPGALVAVLKPYGDMPVAPAKVLLGSPAETIRNRPDIQVAERSLAAATAMQGVAIVEQFPKISLSAFLGLRNTDIESMLKSAAFSYSTGVNLMQPLLNFGRIQAGIDLADAKKKETYLMYEKAVLQALQETETALIRYLKEEIRRQAMSRSVADLKESVRLSQLRYHEGVISFLDVLDSQRILYVAEIDQARSQAAASTNLIALYKAMGGGANVMTQ